MVNKNTKRYLDLKIYPNKSLTLVTLIIFFLLFFLTTVFASFYFAHIGAWPVSLFLLVDFIFVYYAFSKYRKQTKVYDRIILKDKLLIINVNKNGEKDKKIIEPTWLRLKVYSNNKKQYLSIISKGKSVNVGNFLNLKELADLAKLIKKALIKRENHLSFDI